MSGPLHRCDETSIKGLGKPARSVDKNNISNQEVNKHHSGTQSSILAVKGDSTKDLKAGADKEHGQNANYG